MMLGFGVGYTAVDCYRTGFGFKAGKLIVAVVDDLLGYELTVVAEVVAAELLLNDVLAMEKL
jgi:hypothetical protein